MSMFCRKCPHHVRHGQVAQDGKSISFNERCGLLMKSGTQVECKHYPFKKGFDYGHCEVYLSTFKSEGQRNDVVPTSDFQYTDAFSGACITEMELL